MDVCDGTLVTRMSPPVQRARSASVGGRANTASAFADLRAARVALAADVAQAYVDYRAAREGYEALAAQVAAADEFARLLEHSFDGIGSVGQVACAFPAGESRGEQNGQDGNDRNDDRELD